VHLGQHCGGRIGRRSCESKVGGTGVDRPDSQCREQAKHARLVLLVGFRSHNDVKHPPSIAVFRRRMSKGFSVQYQRSEGQRRELERDAGGVWSLESRTGRGQKVTLDTNPEMPITPKDTVARLLELAEAGDWETYVNDYYGEAYKFRDEGDRTVLVSRFRDDWAVQVVEALREVQEIEPILIADDTEAVFQLDGGDGFTLYKDEKGHWKFHL